MTTKQGRLQQAQNFMFAIDEGVPSLIIADASSQFGISYDEAYQLYWQPIPSKTPPPNLPCHYCGQPSVSFGFFDEPICRECGA